MRTVEKEGETEHQPSSVVLLQAKRLAKGNGGPFSERPSLSHPQGFSGQL